MKRSEIKELAKDKVRGNKWNIWWPLIVISTITGTLGSLFNHSISSINNVNNIEEAIKSISTASYVTSTIIGIISAILAAGYAKYILDFVRTGKFDSDLIIKTIKSKWLDVLTSTILVTLIISVLSILFVIPGIIAALALAMVTYLIIDKDVKGHESLSESKKLMHGHKWEYFVFQLSFIGWYLLVPFTLGFLLIWLVPYKTVATTIYYDSLVSKSKKAVK